MPAWALEIKVLSSAPELVSGKEALVELTGVTRPDVTAVTRLMAESFERAIAAKPVDWHMFQPAWPDAPPPS